MLVRIVGQMSFLGWWYPDTYELNRLLPNLDHVFADLEQQVFSCQPSLLFAQKVPYGWFSELMCLGYISYFPLIAAVSLYYYFQRYQDFLMATFVIIASFFAYYFIFVLLPVTGPQFYYLAVGTEKIAAGVFPNIGDWFLTHSERMAAPLPFYVLMCFSTVYIYAHYAIDVLAGLVTGVAFYYLLCHLYNKKLRRRE